MLIQSIKMQMSCLWKKKIVVITYFFLLTLCTLNILRTMKECNAIVYVSQMKDPYKLLTLSDWRGYSSLIMQFYPLLVVLPTAFAYLMDRDSGIRTYIESRCGAKNYWYGKLITVFITTFMIFTIPFLIELLLTVICFDSTSVGDPSNTDYLKSLKEVDYYFLSNVWRTNRFMYHVIWIGLFGIISGILAVFNFSITTFKFMKYTVYTFFPIYLLFHCISFITPSMHLEFTTNYRTLLRPLCMPHIPRNYFAYSIFLSSLFIISLLIIHTKSKEDAFT